MPGHPPDRRRTEPGKITVRGERSESRVTAPQAPPLTVILAGSRLERQEDWPFSAASRPAERGGGNPHGPVSGLPPGGRPPCAEGAKAERPHHGGASRGRVAPARQATRHVMSSLAALRSRAERSRRHRARRALRAFKAVLIVLTGSGIASGIARGDRIRPRRISPRRIASGRDRTRRPDDVLSRLMLAQSRIKRG
jgi:hypothetical protein